MFPDYPFASRFHEVEAGRLHYLDEGEGPVVVLVHGNPTWSFYWRKVVFEMRRSHRVIAVDHLGCGLSDKPQRWSYTLNGHIANLSSLLDTLNITRFSLVMHDWGGAIGFGVAAERSGQIEQLVILNTAAFRSQSMPVRIALCRLPVVGELLVRGLNGFARPALYMAVKKPLAAEVKRAYLAPYDSWHNRIAIDRFVKDIPMKKRHPSMATLERIEASLPRFRGKDRVLILWGGADFCFHMGFYRRWCELFPEAASHCWEEAGHYLLEDAGEEVVPRIAGFLRSGR